MLGGSQVGAASGSDVESISRTLRQAAISPGIAGVVVGEAGLAVGVATTPAAADAVGVGCDVT